MALWSGSKLKLLICVALLPITCSGCITASLATIGTIFGALGSAASTGSDVYKLGKLDAVLNCNGDTCYHAVLAAGEDLSLFLKLDRQVTKDDGTWDLSMIDDLKAPLGVHIEGRSKTLCRCRVDVGFFGSEPTSRLFMQRIRPTSRDRLPHNLCLTTLTNNTGQSWQK